MKFADMDSLVDEGTPEKVQKLIDEFYSNIQTSTHHAMLIVMAAVMKKLGATEISLTQDDLDEMDSDWLTQDHEIGKWTLTIPEEATDV